MKKKTNTLNKTLLFLCLLILTGVFKLNTIYAFGSASECQAECQYTSGMECVQMSASDWRCITSDYACTLASCPAGTHCVPDSSGGLPTCVDDSITPSASLGKRFDLEGLSVNFFRIAFPFAVVLGFINIISAGYAFMTSEGDPRRVNEAKEKLTAAIMGLLFVLLTIAILRIILGTLISGGGVSF